ncbi:hypothetical protein BB561_000175 [Smittium simulii]|uniref:Tyrosine specific protein phosphatases domain-containing protein n=1 Tax=Smittium simulii TaxID=133385 RepID=A0A2T9Z022_9FUNG|nr:hypothetical protein BB561_000175 [Smittium simulii]
MLSIHEFLIPPYRFGQVENRLYRGGYPKQRNFKFLERIKLKTIISLIPDAPTQALTDFCCKNNIKHLVIKVEIPEENVTILDIHVSEFLQIATNSSQLPLYYHCADGSNVTGVLTMCLRKLQLWKTPSIELEFLRFEKNQEIISEESELVRNYNGEGLILHNPYASWLWPHKKHQILNEPNKIPFAKNTHPTLPKLKLYKRIAEPDSSSTIQKFPDEDNITHTKKLSASGNIPARKNLNHLKNQLTSHDYSNNKQSESQSSPNILLSKKSDPYISSLFEIDHKKIKNQILDKALDDISIIKRVNSEKALPTPIKSFYQKIATSDLHDEKSISESPNWLKNDIQRSSSSINSNYNNIIPSVETLKATLSINTPNLNDDQAVFSKTLDTNIYSDHKFPAVNYSHNNSKNQIVFQNLHNSSNDILNTPPDLYDKSNQPRLESSLGTNYFIDYIYILNDNLKQSNHKRSNILSHEIKYNGLSLQLMALALEGLGM